jgi:nucleoside-diphosphate-sugar epimerase
MAKLLIFGGTGVLGAAIADKYQANGYQVTFGVRKITNPVNQFQLPITDSDVPELLKGELFDAVIFAQGANNNDSVINHSPDDLTRLFEANVSFISTTAKSLLLHNLIKHKQR